LEVIGVIGAKGIKDGVAKTVISVLE